MRRLYPCLLMSLIGCASAPSGIEDDLDDQLSIDDKSDRGSSLNTAALLVFTNQASVDDLLAAGLSPRVASAIASYRAADDGLLETADDNRFDGMLELDLVPRVGPRVIAALADHAALHGDIERARATLEVTTETGAVRGIFEGAVTAYFGIPYAAPPVDQLRWRAPQPAISWSGVRDATERTPGCVQISTSQGSVGEVFAGREDCLSLDVYRPTGSVEPLPVLVFIHGGDFVWGAASDFVQGTYVYDGRHLAMKSAVVVTIDYRLGVLGYLANSALAADDPDHLTGNYGLLDQIAALAWVKRNIAAFGGDPSRVMVFGESAGGCSVANLLASPRAHGLFTTAMVESGCYLVWPKARALAAGDRIARELNCDRGDTARCLRSQTITELAAHSQPTLTGYNFAPNIDQGVVDDTIATVEAGAHAGVPVIAGTTSEEYSTLVDDWTSRPINTAADYRAELRSQFLDDADSILAHYPLTRFATPRDAMIAVMTDVTFTGPTRKLLRALADHQTAPVYRYVYSHTMASGPDRPMGAGHALDLIFFFGQFGSPSIAGDPSPGERLLADRAMNYLVQFAATGDPNGRSAPPWPAYTTADDPYLELDVVIGRGSHFRSALSDFWDRLGYY